MKLIINKTQLSGEVNLSGSKISAIASLIISGLTSDQFVFHNFPFKMIDVKLAVNMFERLGKTVTYKNGSIKIEEIIELKSELDDNVDSIRFTPLILAALMIRNGIGKVPTPGGCEIGNRKIDVYKYIFQKFGARFQVKNRYIHGEITKKLIPCKISLPICTTGGTLCALIFGASVEGKSVIINPHLRPEIIDVINILRKMGAIIDIDTNKIKIEGTKSLSGTSHRLIYDFVEAFTFVVFSGATKGEVQINDFPYKDLISQMEIAKNAGIKFEYNNDTLSLYNGNIYPISIKTGPFPKLQSELQPILGAFATLADGRSKIIDTRFKQRYQYANEFKKLGVDIYNDNDKQLIINGNNILTGNEVVANDIRCGVALIIIGLNAKGTTVINNAEQIYRGYENIEKKLRLLGSDVALITDT